jgi:hypothetical protein
MKMELTECSETSAHKIQTPGNHPKERIQYNKCNMLYVYIEIFKNYTILLDTKYKMMYALLNSNTTRCSFTALTYFNPLECHTIRKDSTEGRTCEYA